MKEPSTPVSLFQQITDSAGSGYINRAHQRSFSLNVFQMNAVELTEAVLRVKDPDQGMVLMMEKNREAGRQAHRELNRHVHNFVSSALTLVEHTRVFMRKYYEGTDLLASYESLVTATFVQSPVAQFVQGLRNYMLHKGLPETSMFMNFNSNLDAADGSGKMETGVHYDTVALLDWDGWKPLARTYLEQVGEHLDLHESAQEYLTLVNQFHGWLDATLAVHHQSDLHELSQLQAQFEAISPVRRSVPADRIEVPDSTTVKPFEFTAMQTGELDLISTNLLGKIREVHLQQAPQGFPTERPTTPIMDRDLIGPILAWGQEEGGAEAFIFIQHEGKSYGLPESDFSFLEILIDAVMRSTWARASLSRKFVEKTFCDWARQRFISGGPAFPEILSEAARFTVRVVEVWAPIANMEVEEGFDFGPVRIESITAAVIENWRGTVTSARPGHEQQVGLLFEKLKSEIQGRAAVVISMEADPEFAQEQALRMAEDAVGLIRFFSPASPASFMFSPVALTGAEYVPTSKLILLREGGFLVNQSILPKNVGYWRLPVQQISELKSGLLDRVASLLIPDGLSEFALAVRMSILTHSNGTALVDPLNRLRNCLSALEGILLKHEMEPRAHSVANRMSVILAKGAGDREAVKNVVRQIYWLQDQYELTGQGRRVEQLIGVFTYYAHDVLRTALGSIPAFISKTQFVIEVDRMGLTSQ